MWLDDLQRTTPAERWPQHRRDFDVWLAGEPETEPAADDRKTVLLQALGLS